MSESTPKMTPPAQVSAWRLAALSSLALPIAGAGLPLAVYLPAFYAPRLGLGMVGLIFLVTRIWDSATDPLIGVLSDRTRTRFGRRKPWILVGGLLFGLSVAEIFFAKPSVGPLYLAGWLFLFYLGWTMVQVPLSAWSGELSTLYHERSRVQTFLATATAAGLLAVLALPSAMDQTARASAAANVHVMGGFILVTLAPALILALLAVREPKVTLAADRSRIGVLNVLRLVIGDRLLMRVLVSDFAVTLGQTIRGSLFVFFVVGYMGLARWASLLFLVQFVFGVFAGPIWLQIGYRLGKSRTVVLSELVQALINIGLLFATPGAFAGLLTLTVAQGLAQGSGNLMLRAMVADLADKQRLEKGEARAGLLFSIFSQSGKLATAVAVGVALPLAAALGFSPKGHNTAEALFGLKLLFALGPALAHIVSAALILRFPLDETAHAKIRTKLDLGELLGPNPAILPAE